MTISDRTERDRQQNAGARAPHSARPRGFRVLMAGHRVDVMRAPMQDMHQQDWPTLFGGRRNATGPA